MTKGWLLAGRICLAVLAFAVVLLKYLSTVKAIPTYPTL